MISLYSGTPRSGKTLHATIDIIGMLKMGRNIICTYPIKLIGIKGIKGKFYYIPDNAEMLSKQQQQAMAKAAAEGGYIYLPGSQLTVPFLYKFALKYHKKGRENQTFIVIDEAHRFFNPRDYSKPDRKDWCLFMSVHGHLGFSMILISQHDRLLDRQVRYQIEYEVKHRAIGHYKTFGRILTVLGIKIFVAIHCWYAVKGEKDYVEVFRYKKKYGRLYDSYALFTPDSVRELADGAAHRRGEGVPVEHGTGPKLSNDDGVNSAELAAQRAALIDVLKQVVVIKSVPVECEKRHGFKWLWWQLTRKRKFIAKK